MRDLDSLTNLELVVSRTTGRPEAVFDLSAEQANAVQDALSFYGRVRFQGRALEVDDVREMRALHGLADQVHRRGDDTIPAVIRTGGAEAHQLSEAITFYVAQRDVESYQSPEERRRIRLLADLSDPVRQVALDLRVAAGQLDEQALVRA